MDSRVLLCLLAATTALFAARRGRRSRPRRAQLVLAEPGARHERERRRPGGKVPRRAAWRPRWSKSARGDTYVVCKPNSLRQGDPLDPERARERLEAAAEGEARSGSPGRMRAGCSASTGGSPKRCRFRHIQAAVNKAGNNDRVVVMPGLYLEEPSRRKPTNDPKCVQFEEESENGRGRGDLPLPGRVPQRPEPDLRPGTQADRARRCPSRRARTGTASPTRAPASAATSRSRARA